MNLQQAITVHDYIMDNDLLSEVERRTKEKWGGRGSRTSYYNGMAKTREGLPTGLIEQFMLLEAQSLMVEHREQSLQMQAA